jgi:two-component system uhpT operon response regulator UhpA
VGRTDFVRYFVSEPTIEVDIVEDHAVLREGLVDWLEANSSAVKVVGRFADWADVAAHLGVLSDVVILDVLLGDALPLRAKIHAIVSTGSQVVVCSSVADPAVMRHAMDAGALAYVPKTASAAELEAAVLRAAGGLVSISEEVAAALQGTPAGPQLSAREIEAVSAYLGEGAGTMAEAAASLGISVDGVKKHIASVRRKFQNGSEPLTRMGLRERLLASGWLLDERRR